MHAIGISLKQHHISEVKQPKMLIAKQRSNLCSHDCCPHVIQQTQDAMAWVTLVVLVLDHISRSSEAVMLKLLN